MDPDVFAFSLQEIVSFLNLFEDDLLQSTIALFVIIDSIGTIPLYVTITEKMKGKNVIQFQKLQSYYRYIFNNLCSSENKFLQFLELQFLVS